MDELPTKVIRIDVLRVEHGMQKLCRCFQPHYRIDTQNHLIYCNDCGAIVDPFDAMLKIATNYSNLGDQVEYLLEQRRQIASYKPHLVVMKELEKCYRQQNYSMMPTCPICKEPFDLAELLKGAWLNRAFIKKEGL